MNKPEQLPPSPLVDAASIGPVEQFHSLSNAEYLAQLKALEGGKDFSVIIETMLETAKQMRAQYPSEAKRYEEGPLHQSLQAAIHGHLHKLRSNNQCNADTLVEQYTKNVNSVQSGAEKQSIIEAGNTIRMHMRDKNQSLIDELVQEIRTPQSAVAR